MRSISPAQPTPPLWTAPDVPETESSYVTPSSPCTFTFLAESKAKYLEDDGKRRGEGEGNRVWVSLFAVSRRLRVQSGGELERLVGGRVHHGERCRDRRLRV